MKHLLILIAGICSSTLLFAQPKEVKLSGVLLSADISEEIKISLLGGPEFPLKISSDGSFVFRSSGMPKGYYMFGELFPVYLEPGYDLKLGIQKDSAYYFTGRGSTENNLASDIKKRLNVYLPFWQGGFTSAVNAMNVPAFVDKLNDYRKDVYRRIESLQNIPFRNLLRKDFDFFVRDRVNLYQYSYGIDSIRQDRMFEAFRKKKTYTGANGFHGKEYL